ncbi:MAG: hypothetical protein R2991_01050 [Thermoanaerobaculia bacterium]
MDVARGEVTLDPARPLEVERDLAHPLGGGDVEGGDRFGAELAVDLETVALLEALDGGGQARVVDGLSGAGLLLETVEDGAIDRGEIALRGQPPQQGDEAVAGDRVADLDHRARRHPRPPAAGGEIAIAREHRELAAVEGRLRLDGVEPATEVVAIERRGELRREASLGLVDEPGRPVPRGSHGPRRSEA